MKGIDPRRLTRSIEDKAKPRFGTGSERNGWVYLDGKKVLRVTLPHVHRGDMDPATASSIRNQLHMDRAQFWDLYSCPMSRSQFLEHLARVAAGLA